MTLVTEAKFDAESVQKTTPFAGLRKRFDNKAVADAESHPIRF
jgi:hypothetical protein